MIIYKNTIVKKTHRTYHLSIYSKHIIFREIGFDIICRFVFKLELLFNQQFIG